MQLYVVMLSMKLIICIEILEEVKDEINNSEDKDKELSSFLIKIKKRILYLISMMN